MSGAETFRTSADAYDRHVGRYSPGLASALTAFAGVQSGMRALDVGCSMQGQGPSASAASGVATRKLKLSSM
jgi:hypothetical protein